MVVKYKNIIKIIIVIFLFLFISCDVKKYIFNSKMYLNDKKEITNITFEDYFKIYAYIGQINVKLFSNLLLIYTSDSICLENKGYLIYIDNLDLIISKDTNNIHFVIDSIKYDSCFITISELNLISSSWNEGVSLDSSYFKVKFKSTFYKKNSLKQNNSNCFIGYYQNIQNNILKYKPLEYCSN
jgi:hypothetical protein